MYACLILLSTHWQSNNMKKHDGFTNIDTLVIKSKKKQLLSLPPSRAIPLKLEKHEELLVSKCYLKRTKKQTQEYAYIKHEVEHKNISYKVCD